ncbi:MAG: VWA domain-containing protein [Armatimonadetes bacterium]|nr:VWA domain-containing protein [Armatimonadota bacterium]MDE2206633.1 VWA domain-containing protein [Armatimonadota bacterium]
MEEKTQMVSGAGAAPTIIGGQLGAGPTVMGAPAMALQAECISGHAIAPTAGMRDHALLVLRAAGQQTGRRAPVNVCLCIDRSGSMEGEPIEYVKRACDHVVDMLEPTDILSIVVFEEQIDVLMPARRVVNKDLVKQHIHRLEVGNTTNLYDGMIAACAQVSSVMGQAAGYVSRVLLLTDGEPTAGLKDYTSIVQAVADQRSRGITISALGFGPDYNEELMAGIAKRSGGSYYHIQRSDMLPEVFRHELHTMMSTAARNVTVRLEPARWVQIRQVYGQAASWSGRGMEMQLSDIERGTAQTVLFEMELERHSAGRYRVAQALIQYEDIAMGCRQSLRSDVVVDFDASASAAAPLSEVVAAELEMARASADLQRTVMGMRTQQITAIGAAAQLEKTRAMLAHAGAAGSAREVDEALNALRHGGADAQKTLMGAIVSLDQGRREEGS